MGSTIDELLPTDVATALLGCARRALENGRLQTVEHPLRTIEGVDTFGTVEVDVLAERLDPELETCAYYVVAEALANASKHAGAERLRVAIERSGDTLVVEVADDGRGGAVASPGGGLQGLADRVAAHAGRLRVETPTGGGTLVRAELAL